MCIFRKKRRYYILENYAAEVAKNLDSRVPPLPPPSPLGFLDGGTHEDYYEEYRQAAPAMKALYERVRK